MPSRALCKLHTPGSSSAAFRTVVMRQITKLCKMTATWLLIPSVKCKSLSNHSWHWLGKCFQDPAEKYTFQRFLKRSGENSSFYSINWFFSKAGHIMVRILGSRNYPKEFSKNNPFFLLLKIMLSSNWARLTLFSQLSAAEVFSFLGTPLSSPSPWIQGIQWAWADCFWRAINCNLHGAQLWYAITTKRWCLIL